MRRSEINLTNLSEIVLAILVILWYLQVSNAGFPDWLFWSQKTEIWLF